ncbi:hypothetical protein D3C86_2058920 [compost metagenome]
MLNGADATGAKTVTVAQDFHVVDNRLAAVAWTQKITVKRVYAPLCRNRLFGGIKCLTNHLTAKYLT